MTEHTPPAASDDAADPAGPASHGFESPEGLRALLIRLHEAGAGAWQRDRDAAELMRYTADRYRRLARKYELDAWEVGSASDTSGHAPTGRRRTGRSSDSTARSGTAGPMPGFTVQRPNDAWRCPAGSTSTTTTDTTLRLAAYPSTDSTTSLDITPRSRRNGHPCYA